ncbi:MAG TPA: hypothetical protein VN843_16900, partial [Anaerolineales bacterium]|nr:hypothetical protein [Anaerolineales bacterium]
PTDLLRLMSQRRIAQVRAVVFDGYGMRMAPDLLQDELLNSSHGSATLMVHSPLLTCTFG